jgi:hypothetical protein
MKPQWQTEGHRGMSDRVGLDRLNEMKVLGVGDRFPKKRNRSDFYSVMTNLNKGPYDRLSAMAEYYGVSRGAIMRAALEELWLKFVMHNPEYAKDVSSEKSA